MILNNSIVIDDINDNNINIDKFIVLRNKSTPKFKYFLTRNLKIKINFINLIRNKFNI